jgi:SAM-dependent methyltransferase
MGSPVGNAADKGGTFKMAADAARVYEAVATVFMAPFADIAINAAGIGAGDHVLDLACGTGLVTRRLAAAVGASGRVCGSDISPAMLTVAAELGPAEIEWSQAPADGLPYPDSSFDAVLCQQGLQFFPDRVAALRQVSRVLRPNGRLAATVWAGPERSPYFDAQRAGALAAIGDRARGPLQVAMPSDPERLLTEWAQGADLTSVRTRLVEATVRLPDLATFVELQVAATPWGALLQSAGTEALRTASTVTLDRLRDRVLPDGSAELPFTSALLTAGNPPD